MDRMRIHSGLIAAVVAQIALTKTTWGFKVRAVGENAAAARHAGIDVNRTLLARWQNDCPNAPKRWMRRPMRQKAIRGNAHGPGIGLAVGKPDHKPVVI